MTGILAQLLVYVVSRSGQRSCP